jgi:hypothetical protein
VKDLIRSQENQIKQLQASKAELVEALEELANHTEYPTPAENLLRVIKRVRSILAKHKGEDGETL